MIKKLGKVVVVGLVVVGALNFHSLNASAFKAITTTVTTKALGEIPGAVFDTVAHHSWKFVKKS